MSCLLEVSSFSKQITTSHSFPSLFRSDDGSGDSKVVLSDALKKFMERKPEVLPDTLLHKMWVPSLHSFFFRAAANFSRYSAEPANRWAIRPGLWCCGVRPANRSAKLSATPWPKPKRPKPRSHRWCLLPLRPPLRLPSSSQRSRPINRSTHFSREVVFQTF